MALYNIRLKTKQLFLPAMLGFIAIVYGCNKEIVVDTSLKSGGTFLKVQNDFLYDKNYTIGELQNGNFLIAGSIGNRNTLLSNLSLTYLDKFGNTQNTEPQFYGYAFKPYLTTSAENTYFLNDSRFPMLTKFDENGNQLFDSLFSKRGGFYTILGVYEYSKPALDNQNNLHIALTENHNRANVKKGSGLYGIININGSTGNEFSFDSIPQGAFDGTPIFISVLKSESGAHWLLTQESNNDTSLSNEYAQHGVYVKKMVDGRIDQSLSLSDAGIVESQNLQEFAVLNDGHYIILTGESSARISNTYASGKSITATNVNSSLEQIWQKAISLEATSIIANQIKVNNDGQIAILGTCKPDHLPYNSGFVVLLSSTGEVVKTQFIDLGQEAHFEDFIQLPDYSYIFVGGISNFGSGIEDFNGFTLKTNHNFKLK